MDPIYQRVDTIRSISSAGYMLGAVLDSGRNIWYWTNDTYGKTWDQNSPTPIYHAILGVHSSFSPNTVHVRFENDVVEYGGSPTTIKAFVWVEDHTVDGENKKVSGQVKLVLSGGDAKFVSNTQDTLTITTEVGKESEVEITANGPDRVTVTAYMTR